jgi:hypothetical protein
MDLLPAEFAELEPFAATWCLPTEAQRYALRLASSMAELQVFYDAVTPRLEAAIDHCDQFPLDDLPDDALHLLQLLLAYVTVTYAVEVWLQPDVVNAGAASIERYLEPAP